MKVNQNSSSIPTSVDATRSAEKSIETAAKNRAQSKDQSLVGTGGAQVEISENAHLMKKATDLVRSTPDVRADKVADLKRQIREGTYKVDSAAVAERLIQEHLLTNFESKP